MVLKIIYFIISIIFIIVASLDICPMINQIMGKYKIGKFKNKKEWENKILEVAKSWLIKTPKIKVTDNTRLTIIDRVKGQYSNHNIQHWQEAALLLGLNENKKRNDKEIEKYINEFLNKKFNSNGTWVNEPKSVDSAILAYALMNINDINVDKYKLALDSTWNMINNHIGEDRTVKYRNYMKDYRYVDTIGFICPFLIKYGLKYGKSECIDLAVKQIREYRKYAVLEDKEIPYHAYNIKTEIPLGLCGWGRGLGWYAIGLIDSWNELSEQHKYKKELTEYVEIFAKSAMKLQNENGGWSWTATRRETRTDSSTTATLSWFLINASKISNISLDCKESVDKAMKYLMSVTKRNGEIDFSQGDTKDIGVYSMLFDILPFTQGFVLRTTSKLFKEE